ncbi:hypothetical protein PoB_007413600 [Plakobranchus ocellatus]|uniref:Uncharacterized protein n=1 Tax=Plakobranchus ocellatus TaxID=259542 RepID=A0AAV4DU74_9GAST|nr:hypothetical protein PoB_007413600 [Plakobranchus ocellatus]
MAHLTTVMSTTLFHVFDFKSTPLTNSFCPNSRDRATCLCHVVSFNGVCVMRRVLMVIFDAVYESIKSRSWLGSIFVHHDPDAWRHCHCFVVFLVLLAEQFKLSSGLQMRRG